MARTQHGVSERRARRAHCPWANFASICCFEIHRGQQLLSHALEGEDIALEEMDDAIWTIIYYNTIPGWIDLKTGSATCPTERTLLHSWPLPSTSFDYLRYSQDHQFDWRSDSEFQNDLGHQTHLALGF